MVFDEVKILVKMFEQSVVSLCLEVGVYNSLMLSRCKKYEQFDRFPESVHSKKKVLYETTKGSSPGHRGRSFYGSVKKRFRMKPFVNYCK